MPWTAIIIAALVSLDLGVFAQTAHHGFIDLDDNEYLTGNAVVQHGLSWAGAWWAFTTTHFPYWHPLTWLSHMLDVRLFGMQAGGHHMTSLLLHVANTVLLFLGLLRLTGARGRSAFVAALFGIHPLHVESVAWLAERKDVLSTLCWWLTIGAYLRYVRRPGPARYAAIVAALACGLMAKPILVTAPITLLLLDVWPLERAAIDAGWRAWTPLVREKLPLLALSAASAVATVLVQQQVGATISVAALPVAVRLTHPFESYVWYLVKAIWPTGLSAFYTYREPFTFGPAIFAIVVCLALTLAVVRLARRRPYVAVGWAWYAITLLPVIGFLQAGSQAMADRFTYVPLVGIFVIASWGAPDLLQGAFRTRAIRGGPARLLTAAAMAIVLAFAAAAWTQTGYWQDSFTLWSHALDVSPDNYLAHASLGTAWLEEGRPNEAAAAYLQAVRIKPAYLTAQYNLGLILSSQGRVADAIDHFRLALEADPASPDAHTGLGAALASQGRIDEAIAQYRAALRARPDMAIAHLRLGLALQAQSHAGDALDEFSAVIRLQPGLATAWSSRGGALASVGRSTEAVADYREAVRLKPDLETAHLGLGLALAAAGRPADAASELAGVLREDPGNDTARAALHALHPPLQD